MIKTVLDSLMANGTITQVQVDKIIEIIANEHGPKEFLSALDRLVTNATITQAQEDAIKNAIK